MNQQLYRDKATINPSFDKLIYLFLDDWLKQEKESNKGWWF